MWTLVTKYVFDAAHSLPHHDGKCHKHHGHTYTVKVFIASNEIKDSGPSQGMVIDFKSLKSICSEVINKFDHESLNDYIHNPTAENIAVEIFRGIKKALLDISRDITLKKISIMEGEDDEVIYEE